MISNDGVTFPSRIRFLPRRTVRAVLLIAVVNSNNVPTSSFLNYGPKMINDDFDGSKGFAIEGGLKDAMYVALQVVR
jgi:hypothetical protein